jgi:hypothetical protein
MINVTARQLRSQWSRTQFVNKNVQNILTAIEDRVMDAHRDSRTSITFGAPVNFDIPEMTNKDASILVYYNIIQELEKKEFKVTMEMSTSETTFVITWNEAQDDDSLNHMLKYIASKRTDTPLANYKRPKVAMRKKKKTLPSHSVHELSPTPTLTPSSPPTPVSQSRSNMQQRSGYLQPVSNPGNGPPPIPDILLQLSGDGSSKNKKGNYLSDYDELL